MTTLPRCTRLLAIFVATGGSVSVPIATQGQEQPKRPLWLDVSGTHRTRIEHLWNNFQPTAPGNDAALSLRTTLLAELRHDAVTVGVELADSRVYLKDENTPLGTSHVNPVDVLQAYVSANIPDAFASGSNLRMKVGRQTMDGGSRRFVARNRFRNTINSRTGIDLEWTSPGTEISRAFVMVPVQRRVNSIVDNDPRLDIERTEAVFWGVFLRSRPWPGSIRGELQLYGLHEGDSEEFATRNRNFVAPGFRLYRAPASGGFDFEIESVVQVGHSRATSSADDLTDLTHFAFFAHASVGWTFADMWRRRVVIQYDYASGDGDPNDDKNGRFDTLYGARRFEYNPTGIYGAFARSNISSPGIRLEFAPHPGANGFFGYRSMWLANGNDSWTTTGIRDVSATASSFLGHQIEGRLRWPALQGHGTLEAGFARLWMSEFSAPSGNAAPQNPVYVYSQVTLRF